MRFSCSWSKRKMPNAKRSANVGRLMPMLRQYDSESRHHLQRHSRISPSPAFFSIICKLTAFSSCTTTLSIMETELDLEQVGERAIFSIEVFNGRNERAHSLVDTKDEILVLSGTHMDVVSRLGLGRDFHIIHLKQMRPDEILLDPPFAGNNRSARQLVPLWILSFFQQHACIRTTC